MLIQPAWSPEFNLGRMKKERKVGRRERGWEGKREEGKRSKRVDHLDNVENDSAESSNIIPTAILSLCHIRREFGT